MSGFKTPDHYFETFSAKVMQQLPVQEERKVISIFQRRKTWIMAVAAVLVLALMLPIYNRFSNSAELDEVTLENYITDQSNINQYDLVSLLEAEDIEKMKVDLPLEDEMIEDILSTNTNLEQIITE
ncbi:hypothetical protein [Flavobacterium sp. GT3R68]|uniref:hypothetical protein n=1 Tax=Flavobacterium sp. GT3R68 TaxID=2594437 RepID=UPI0021046A01|nr:hypothetical protein [Flavobacterium sp. GT3R68]